jgi:hypothetical protein
MASALLARPVGCSCVKKPTVCDRAQLTKTSCPSHVIFLCKQFKAVAVPLFRNSEIPDFGQVLVGEAQIIRTYGRLREVSDSLGKRP